MNSDKKCEDCKLWENFNYCPHCGKINEINKTNTKKDTEIESKKSSTKLEAKIDEINRVFGIRSKDGLKQLFDTIKYLDFQVDVNDIKKNLPQLISQVPVHLLERDNFLSPIYHTEFKKLLKKLAEYEFSGSPIFIIDIKDIILEVVDNKLVGILEMQNFDIYTKDEYEKNYYPFLEYCPDWMEKSYKYIRNLNLKGDNKLETDCFDPIIKDVIYFISSGYSDFLNMVLYSIKNDLERVTCNKLKICEKRDILPNTLNHVIESDILSFKKIIFSGFEINAENIGEIDINNLPIILAGLNGIKIKED